MSMSKDRSISDEEENLFDQVTGKHFTRRSFLKWSSALAGVAVSRGFLWDDRLWPFRRAGGGVYRRSRCGRKTLLQGKFRAQGAVCPRPAEDADGSRGQTRQRQVE